MHPTPRLVHGKPAPFSPAAPLLPPSPPRSLPSVRLLSSRLKRPGPPILRPRVLLLALLPLSLAAVLFRTSLFLRGGPSAATPAPRAPLPSARVAQPRPGRAGHCSTRIVYDKPFKTGSTAVTCAVRRYLARRAARDWKCGRNECLQIGRKMCQGALEERSLLGHFLEVGKARNASQAILTRECLKRKGFYAVTSVREPTARWRSMFLYNRQERGSHYGIGYGESYGVFVRRVPECLLHHYYDGEGKECAGRGEERMRRIVERFDEVIDLYEGAEEGGELRRRIEGYLVEENVSAKKSGGDGMQGELDEDTLMVERERTTEERRLYDELKRRGRLGGERWLCDNIGDKPGQADPSVVARIEEDMKLSCPNGQKIGVQV